MPDEVAHDPACAGLPPHFPPACPIAVGTPPQAVEDPDRLLPQVEDTAAVVTVDGYSVPIKAYGDGRWFIDGDQLSILGARYGIVRLHRDRQAAIDAAGMLAVDLVRARRRYERAKLEAEVALATYAYDDPAP